MNIEWNRVTWYSKLLAAVLFVLIIPAWTFYLGTQYEQTQVLSEEGIGVQILPVVSPTIPSSPMPSVQPTTSPTSKPLPKPQSTPHSSPLPSPVSSKPPTAGNVPANNGQCPAGYVYYGNPLGCVTQDYYNNCSNQYPSGNCPL